MSVKDYAIAIAFTVAGAATLATVSYAALYRLSDPDAARPVTAVVETMMSRRGGGFGGGGMRGGFQRGGFSGGSREIRGSASASINHGIDRNFNRNSNYRNVNYNRNVNVNRNWNGGYDWDDHWHPVARGVAVGAAAAATAAAIGSVAYSVPLGCGNVYVNGYSYYQCGNTWYQPQYAGSSVQYVVVESPQ